MGDKVAFLYAPVGWQRPDMGRRLYEREAVFREALDAAAAPHASSRKRRRKNE